MPLLGRAALRCAAFTVLFVLALWVGRTVRPDGSQVALVWPAAGVGVWWLWSVAGRRLDLVACSAVLALTTVGVNLLTGAPWPLAVAFGPVNLVHALVGVGLLRRWLPAGRLDAPVDLLRLLGASMLAGAAGGVLSVAAVAATDATDDPLRSAVLFVVRNGGTTFLVLATVLSLRAPHDWRELLGRGRHADSVLVGAVCLGLYAFVFLSPVPYPVLFVAVAASVLAGLRLGVPRTSLLLLTAGAAAVESAAHGHGSLAVVTEPESRAVIVQAFLVLAAVVGLTLALLVRSNEVATAALARQAADLQDLHDSALVGKAVVRRGADGGWTLEQANPALVRLLGADPSGSRWRHVLDPDDARFLRPLVDALADGARPAVSVEVRHVRADGLLVWTEVHVSRLRGAADGGVLVAQVADLTERKAVEQRLSRLALNDALTGLLNRTSLADQLNGLLLDPRQQRVGVLFLDLDRFKAVNDQHGHEAGDRLLKQVAATLRAALRPEDVVCRLGGDEFVACCPGLADESDLALVAERVRRSLAPVLTDLPGVPGLGVSVGAVLAGAGDDVDSLLRRSDASMYAAKRATRSPEGARAG